MKGRNDGGMGGERLDRRAEGASLLGGIGKESYLSVNAMKRLSQLSGGTEARLPVE